MSTSRMLLGLIRPLCLGALARPEGIYVFGICVAAGLVVVGTFALGWGPRIFFKVFTYRDFGRAAA